MVRWSLSNTAGATVYGVTVNIIKGFYDVQIVSVQTNFIAIHSIHLIPVYVNTVIHIK